MAVVDKDETAFEIHIFLSQGYAAWRGGNNGGSRWCRNIDAIMRAPRFAIIKPLASLMSGNNASQRPAKTFGKSRVGGDIAARPLLQFDIALNLLESFGRWRYIFRRQPINTLNVIALRRNRQRKIQTICAVPVLETE